MFLISVLPTVRSVVSHRPKIKASLISSNRTTNVIDYWNVVMYYPSYEFCDYRIWQKFDFY
jgi:hypothetical protein